MTASNMRRKFDVWLQKMQNSSFVQTAKRQISDGDGSSPKKIIIVEGLFLFHYVQVNQMLDFSIFVDVDLETQLDRRIYRDQESRGYDESDIIYQWNNHVTPCFKNYIEPFKEQ